MDHKLTQHSMLYVFCDSRIMSQVWNAIYLRVMRTALVHLTLCTLVVVFLAQQRMIHSNI
jgi:hypothetical protein